MSEGNVTTDGAVRAPASKAAVAMELGSVGAAVSAIGPALAEWNVPPATAVLVSALASALFGVGMSYLRDRRAARAAAGVLLALSLGMASAPAYAQEAEPETPLFGCGGGVCSIYVLSAGWTPYTPGNGPLRIGGNLVDFVSGGVGVGLGGVHVEGDLNFLGGACRIPKVGPALSFACGGVTGE